MQEYGIIEASMKFQRKAWGFKQYTAGLESLQAAIKRSMCEAVGMNQAAMETLGCQLPGR
jgi:hypothetical protein